MPKTIIENLLQREDFPQGECWQEISFPAQAEIISRGEESTSLYFILEGEVRVTGNVETMDGREIHPGFTTLGQGEIFGELVLFDSLPRSASVVTVDESRIAVINGQCLMEYMQRNKEVGFDIVMTITRAMAARLRQTNEQLFAIYAWGLKMHDIDKYL